MSNPFDQLFKTITPTPAEPLPAFLARLAQVASVPGFSVTRLEIEDDGEGGHEVALSANIRPLAIAEPVDEEDDQDTKIDIDPSALRRQYMHNGSE